jgi:hypothetical protein
MNQMKHTICLVCNQNMDNMTFDQMLAHVNRHSISHKGQKQMSDF